MRAGLLALALLAACAPQPNSKPAPESVVSPAPPQVPAVAAAAFPDIAGAAYRLEARLYDNKGRVKALTMARDHGRTRLETGDGADLQVIITNPVGADSFLIMPAGPIRIALRVDSDALPDIVSGWAAEIAAHGEKGQPCTVAGETGDEWRRTDENGDIRAACVSRDGVLLRSKIGDRTLWEATSVARGPQPDALFALPPGQRAAAVGPEMSARAAEELEKLKRKLGL